MNAFTEITRLFHSMRRLTRRLSIVVAYGLCAANLAQSQDHHDDAHDGHESPIELDDEYLNEFGIRVATAKQGSIHEELRLPGEIRLNQDTAAHVSPRFEGIVTEIHKRLGEEVREGDLLANLESNETLQAFELRAPIHGTVIDYHVTFGESLEVGEYAYVIADTSTVWADLNVYQRDLPKVRKGQSVRVSAGHEFPSVRGKVSYIGPTVDETSRTGLARIVLDNPEGAYRPGLFIVGNVLLEEETFAVVVPLSALHSVNGKTVVYVEAHEGDGFEAREVVVGHRDSQFAEIRRGLDEGESYVSEGGFFLKAESQKEDFGDGHNH